MLNDIWCLKDTKKNQDKLHWSAKYFLLCIINHLILLNYVKKYDNIIQLFVFTMNTILSMKLVLAKQLYSVEEMTCSASFFTWPHPSPSSFCLLRIWTLFEEASENRGGDMAGLQGREWSENTGQKGNTVDVFSQPWGRLWLMCRLSMLSLSLSLCAGLSVDAAVGAVSVAVAGCTLRHLGNVLVPVGFCGHTESAGTHRYANAPLA